MSLAPSRSQRRFKRHRQDLQERDYYLRGLGGSKKIVGPALKRTGRALMVSPHKFLLTDLQLSLPQHYNSCHHHQHRRRRLQHVCVRSQAPCFQDEAEGEGSEADDDDFPKKCFKKLCHAGRMDGRKGCLHFHPWSNNLVLFRENLLPIKLWKTAAVLGCFGDRGLSVEERLDSNSRTKSSGVVQAKAFLN